jgi:CRP/FNR family transcriptional regulator, cyclic AMP receptor protein
MTPAGAAKKKHDFDPDEFLATIAAGRTIVSFPKKHIIFAQGDECDSVFYIQKGKVRLTVVSKTGKEATIGILSTGDFFGESCLTGQSVRVMSAISMEDCCLMSRRFRTCSRRIY